MDRFFIDSHTHSVFSSDGEMSMENALERVLAMNLAGIAFTDHFDIDYVDMEDDFHVDFENYFKKIEALRSNPLYKDIKVLRAVEIGLQTHVLDQTDEAVSKYNFDYIIGSVHIVNRKDVYKAEYFKDKCKIEAYASWLAAIHDNIHLYSKFDTLGHFDYVARKAPYEDRIMYYKDFADIFDEIFKFIISRGIALEINTSTYNSAVFDRNVLKRYKELGGEMITLGSDAHNTNRIADHFSTCAAIIKDCGFDYITHFENRKPVLGKMC